MARAAETRDWMLVKDRESAAKIALAAARSVAVRFWVAAAAAAAAVLSDARAPESGLMVSKVTAEVETTWAVAGVTVRVAAAGMFK